MRTKLLAIAILTLLLPIGLAQAAGGVLVSPTDPGWDPLSGAGMPAGEMPAGIEATPIYVDDDTYDAATCTAAGHTWGVDCTNTVQGGIGLVDDGGTINVAAGNYVETGQIAIAKNVSIVGADKTTVTIRPNQDTGGSGDARGWWLVSSGYTFNLSGVTLDGQGWNVMQGIRSLGSGTINDIAMQNISYPGYNGLGVALFGNMTISNSTFTNIGRVGIIAFGSGCTTSVISGNTYTGKGVGDWLDYGIEVGGGAQVTISNNTISGCLGVATSDGSTSAGILVTTFFGAGTQATITGCTLTGNTTGIAVGYDASDTSVVVAHGNSIYGNASYGISSTGPAVDATDNWWGSASGPAHDSNAFNVETQGNAVDDGVGFVPWLNAAPPGGVSFAPVTTTDPVGSYASIQAGIDGSNPGGTVNAAAGTYVENVWVNKAVELAGAGAATTTIYPAVSLPNPCSGSSLCGSRTAASNIILTEASDITIHGFTLDGDNPNLTSEIVRGGADLDARNGIIEWTSPAFNNLTVYDTTVKNIYLRGIYANSYGSGFYFHDNTVQNVQGEANSIAIFNFGCSGMIENNTVSDANDAIAANHSRGTQFLNNTVTNSGSGVHTDNNGSMGGTADLIQGNSVTCPGSGYGVWVFVPYLAVTLDQNTITGCDVGLSAWGQGAAVTALFTNNTVTGPSKAAGSVGAYITTDLISWGYTDVSVDLRNNLITDFETAVYLTADPQSWNPDPWESKTIYSVFYDNSFDNNTNGMDLGTQGTYNADASANWWGSADPATVKSAANDGSVVDYTPWLASGTDTSIGPGFQGDFASLWVDDDSPQTGTTGRVQEGVALVTAGGTVNAAEGTYEEQVVIGKNLTLTGVGPTTIIASPATLAPYTIGGTPRRPIVYVHDAAVTVQQLAVDGNGLGNANYPFMGIAYHNAAGVVDAVTITEIRDTPFSGAQHGVGLYARNEDGVARTLDVSDVTITDFQKNGMTLIGSGLTANVSSCTVTGAGLTTINGQNGIQISGGAGGTVEDCNVSGIAWIGTGWIACGMLFQQGATVDVSGGSILNSQVGIRYSDTSGSVDGLTFVAADIENVEGISVLDYGSAILAAGGKAPLPASPVDEGAFFKGAGIDGAVTSVTIDSVDLTGTRSTRDDDYGVDVWGMGDAVNASVTNSDLQEWSIAIVAYDYTSAVDVTAHQNCIESNDWGFYAYTAAVQDADNNWWGDASGPYHDPSNPAGLGDGVTDNVDFEPWITDGCGGTATGANWQNTTTLVIDDLQDSLDNALPGQTIIPIGAEPLAGGGIANVAGVTIDLSGQTVGPGSPAFTINADDITIKGPGILDGDTGSGNSIDPAILVNAGADNFILDGVEIRHWADGVELAGDVTSFKMGNNWIHLNTDAGLQIDSAVTNIGGILTIEGNLFKANGGDGIQNNSAFALDAEYNSWGDLGGPAVGNGDGVSAGVDYEPWTFIEFFFDVDPDTEALVRDVPEATSFDVALKADAWKVYALSFVFSYDPDMLALNSTTFAAPWTGQCFALPAVPGTVSQVCYLLAPTPEWDVDGGTIATFNFTSFTGPVGELGPWTTYLDISDVDTDTSAAAIGGVKVWVNNAGYDDPSIPDRDITDANDGQINIDGAGQFTGWINLQGRLVDSLATVQVYDQSVKAGATLLAEGASDSSGAYTTTSVGGSTLTIGTTYWLVADRRLYLPTTVALDANYAHSHALENRPLTSLETVLLLGGDATNNDLVDIYDAACIAGDYGSTSGFSTCGALNGLSDVNEDGVVDIFDMALMGGNYLLTASPWTP